MSVTHLTSSCAAICVAVVYHSPYGHTAKVAQHIAQGAAQMDAQVTLMDVAEIEWDSLDQADIIVMGCPTYMGSITSALKQFMEGRIYSSCRDSLGSSSTISFCRKILC